MNDAIFTKSKHHQVEIHNNIQTNFEILIKFSAHYVPSLYAQFNFKQKRYK